MSLQLGEVVRRLRTERGLTQLQLARELNVSPQAVSRWENGSTYPDITLLPEIANFFGVSADLLLGIE